MGNIWKPQTREVLKSWIDALRTEASEELTDWETEFLEGCDRTLEFKEHLSQR